MLEARVAHRAQVIKWRQIGLRTEQAVLNVLNPRTVQMAAAVVCPRAARVTRHVSGRIEPHVDRMVLALGLTYPLAMAPQLYNVWALDQTAGISSFTSAMGLVMSLAWTLYGLIHRQKSIWLANGVWIAVHGAMIAGLLR